ncbi:MAG: hypothetical protein ACRELB_17065 [Polyangiaceae bacterium]
MTPSTPEQHCALARSLLSHFVNTPLAIVMAAVEHLEGAVDPAQPLLRPRVVEAVETLADARIGLERLLTVASVLLSGLPTSEAKVGIATAGRVLVVTSDTAASAAVCSALHGDSLTVCATVPQALRLIERVEPFEVIFCEASLAVAWLLVRVAWQDPPPRMVFLATQDGDPKVAEFLERHALHVEAPLDAAHIRRLAVAP